MAKPIAEKVIAWMRRQPEMAGFEPELDIELRGARKGAVYRADLLFRRRGKWSWIFRRGPLSGTAYAFRLRGGIKPVGPEEIAATQAMAFDVLQAVVRGKEGCPVDRWAFVASVPFTDEAKELALRSRLVWCGTLDQEGEIHPIVELGSLR